MNLEAGLLHESQRLGAQIEKVLKPASWAEALDMYAAFPDARPLAGARLRLVRSRVSLPTAQLGRQQERLRGPTWPGVL